MSYALAKDLRAIGRTLEEGQVKLAARFDNKKNVFLSHSHLDGDLVKGVLRVLRRHGATPYVDWDDDALVGLGSLDRAVVLRTRIKSCGRLVMLMSDEGAKSGWMPWELGLADGLHSRVKAVTFPVLEGKATGEGWARREYLAAYPRIEPRAAAGSTGTKYVVVDPQDGKYWELGTWLTL